MKSTVNRFKNNVKQKIGVILLFGYGIIVGTSAPLLLSKCATGGANCATCGGACGIALGIVPLLLIVTMKSRFKNVGQQTISFVRKIGHRQNG